MTIFIEIDIFETIKEVGINYNREFIDNNYYNI